MKKLFYILLFIAAVNSLSAQEFLINCGNPVLKEYAKSHNFLFDTKYTQEVDTLDLPFFDDFAESYIYPDELRWLDRFAFINNGFANNPISYGVATLDAVNEFGEVYSHLPSLSSGIADYFTSAPINLEVLIEDSVYMSFYYQAGGLGNSPEERDSLVLQFIAPDTTWHSVWHVGGGEAMDTFNLVMIPITAEYYLKKGFQFRFLNYASVSTNYEPSWISNTDYWHIDYIQIDTARSYADTFANDVAFIHNFNSMIIDFEAVPWNHYKAATDDLMYDTVTFIYKNTWEDDEHNINRQIQIVDLMGSDAGLLMDDDSENILPGETIEYDRFVDYVYNSDSEDSAKFMLKGYLKTDFTSERYRYRWNDTIRYYQDFYNYYAYDDGTAEKGYGITGQGTAYSSLAYEFSPLVSDSLKGVYIYFNQVMNEGNRKYFFLTVWADDDGIPGDTIYQKIGVIPEYSDELNQYLYYPLDTSLFIEGKFYIGWIKTTDDMLNCGFDTNRDAHNHLFYNVSGEWMNSSIEGALMIRPVFAYEPVDLSEIITPTIKSEFDIYPNPTTDYLNISSIDDYSQLHIYDAVGRLILSAENISQVYVGDLQAGTYFIKLESDNNVFKTKKFLILR